MAGTQRCWERWRKGRAMMITKLRPLSRPAEAFRLIDAADEHKALLAERHLLRSLLRRCEGVLQNVAIEARTAGERDAIVEELLRDISVATE